jgi:galactokinase
MAVAAQDLLGRFQERYKSTDSVRVFRAPGRTNLIGEHTDYNAGFVLPVALNMTTHVAIAPNGQGVLRIASENNGESVEIPAGDLPFIQPRKDWTDYVIGVAVELHKAGIPIEGANLLISSTVPVGAGLSSSAALEVSSALALLAGRRMEKIDLARLAQRAENGFVGLPCGLMDQYISVFGEVDKAVLIDCQSQTHTMVNLPKVEILAVNTMVKHELGSSAYRIRVAECAEAVAAAQQLFPEVKSLRDMSSQQVEAIHGRVADNVYHRARHVTTEDERVLAFMRASEGGDLAEMGRLFVGSHRSLQHDYEVSCEELDFLVDTAIGIPGVYGARMTGGGFGGCTVNLLDAAGRDAFESTLLAAYKDKFGIDAKIYECHPSAGATEVV